MAALLVVLGVVGRAMDLGNSESSTVEAGAESGGGPEPLVSVSFTLTPGGGGEPEMTDHVLAAKGGGFDRKFDIKSSSRFPVGPKSYFRHIT